MSKEAAESISHPAEERLQDYDKARSERRSKKQAARTLLLEKMQAAQSQFDSVRTTARRRLRETARPADAVLRRAHVDSLQIKNKEYDEAESIYTAVCIEALRLHIAAHGEINDSLKGLSVKKRFDRSETTEELRQRAEDAYGDAITAAQLERRKALEKSDAATEQRFQHDYRQYRLATLDQRELYEEAMYEAHLLREAVMAAAMAEYRLTVAAIEAQYAKQRRERSFSLETERKDR